MNIHKTIILLIQKTENKNASNYIPIVRHVVSIGTADPVLIHQMPPLRR